jgi:Icc protein
MLFKVGDSGRTLVGHLTDTHVVPRGDSLFGIDTVAQLEAAVDDMARLNPRPDVVVVTGDVTARGERDAYVVALDLLERLELPLLVVPGNHDDRAAFVEVFRPHLIDGGFVQEVLDVGELRVVAVDTLDEGRDGGSLSEERLAALGDVLDDAPGRPTVVCMHHPPFATGIEWMDEAGLEGVTNFERLIASHPQVGLIACGHIHRSISSNLGQTRVAVAPSTAFEVHLDLGHDRGVVAGPPAYALHRFDRGQWVTHVARVDGLPVRPV